MKTALQELIEFITEHRDTDPDSMNLIIKSKAKILLSKEREQILSAFTAGDERGTGDIPYSCEQYYKQTFKL